MALVAPGGLAQDRDATAVTNPSWDGGVHEIRPDHLETASARRVDGRALPRAHRADEGGARRRLRPDRHGAALPLDAVPGDPDDAVARTAGRRRWHDAGR